jgi:hypothetical protein
MPQRLVHDLRRVTICLALLAPLSLAGCMGGTTTMVLPDGIPAPALGGPATPPAPPGDPFLAHASFGLLVNDRRSAGGLRSVEENGVLNAVATAHAQDLVTYNYLSHIGRDGRTPEDRARAGGYNSSYIGEALARGTNNGSAVIEGWMNSPKHRDIVMAPQAEDFGLGRVNSTWVLMMGAEAR